MRQMTTRAGRFMNPQSFFAEHFGDDDNLNWGRWLGRESIPAVNVLEKEDSFQIEVAAPGFDKKDFDLRMEGEQLIVSAEKRSSKKEEKQKLLRQEFSYNAFQRSFTLPEGSQADDIKASYEHGVLRVNIARHEAAPAPEPKRIEIG